MDYRDILLCSENLDILQKVCSEFYHTLQSKTFWKEKSERDRIEPPVTCMQEWIKHKQVLNFSMREDLDKIVTTINKETLPENIFDFLGLAGIQVSNIYRTEMVLKKEEDGAMWSLSAVFHTPGLGKCSIQFKKLNKQEKQLLVYGVKRGTQKTITL